MMMMMMIITIQDQVVAARCHHKHIIKMDVQNTRCRLCKKEQETILYLISACTQSRPTAKENSIVSRIIRQYCVEHASRVNHLALTHMQPENIFELLGRSLFSWLDLKNLAGPLTTHIFNIPQVRSRLEKLMGTNYVNLTDRVYMQRLQQRILEDYEDSMDKRIKVREEEEMERVKNLVLIGKIPLDQAPPEMARHPIMLIENYCNRLIAERRAKIKMYKIKIPKYLYWDDTPDPPTGLSIEMGHVFGQDGDKLCQPVEKHIESSEEEDLQLGYMMAMEEFDKAKYENNLVKKLLSCETVEEMYALADDIIGILKSLDENNKMPDDISDSFSGS
ncbi:uncharacterized protein LOC132697665 [Cylas formicarius]|uniref:uncharacterized protein LOC132697665 n=1 Tax=Cylas formicarius TaxID=197179 RepID=UPI00295895EA|nr:uncharacterized protein LOC132697665 [Cylas formicarius]